MEANGPSTMGPEPRAAVRVRRSVSQRTMPVFPSSCLAWTRALVVDRVEAGNGHGVNAETRLVPWPMAMRETSGLAREPVADGRFMSGSFSGSLQGSLS